MSLTRAIRLARKSDHLDFRHATLLMRGGNIVASGFNKGHKHAEVMALERLWPNGAKGCDAVNIRLTRAGRLAMAKPCAECQAHLRESGVRRVSYSTPEGGFEQIKW